MAFLSQISQMGERRFENPQTMNLQEILASCVAIHQLLAEKEKEEEEGEEEEKKSKMVGVCVS